MWYFRASCTSSNCPDWIMQIVGMPFIWPEQFPPW
jgi:hypothetical protein